MKKVYRVECSKISDLIEIENGIVIDTLPMLQKLQGQRMGNLTNWLKKKFGWVTIKREG